MTTVIRGPRPPELEAIIERRQRFGQDLFDEVWEGVYHLAPGPSPDHGIADDEVAAALRPFAKAAGLIGSGPFNVGSPDNYRVPDRGLHRSRPTLKFVPTAALVVEVISPYDESWVKLDFYFDAGVEELVMVDPANRKVTWLARAVDGWAPTEHSDVLGVHVGEVTKRITFP